MKANDELRQDVLDELKWEPMLREVSKQIGVHAEDGVITLSGLVNTYSQKLAAEQAAQRVAGVSVVAVDLEVHITSNYITVRLDARKLSNKSKPNSSRPA